MSEDLKRIGASMANIMFNLAQRAGEPITAAWAATMNKLRNEWDAASRATPSTSHASDADEEDRVKLFTELNWCIEEGNIGPRSKKAIIAARNFVASTRTASDTRTAAGEAECDAALRAAPASQHDAGGTTTIVQDVAGLFAACGFEVREDGGQLAIAGSLDAAGVLVDAVIEHFAAGAERFDWNHKGMMLSPDGFYVHYRRSDDLKEQK